MTEQTSNDIRGQIKSIIYGRDNDAIYEKAKVQAKSEGLTYQETVNERSDELEREMVPDAIMQLFEEYKAKEIAEIEKAYGGCHKCYGKGYATQDSATIGFDDFGDEGFKRHELKMIFCDCSRGKQLKTLSTPNRSKEDEDE